jgi:hypothetical protein
MPPVRPSVQSQDRQKAEHFLQGKILVAGGKFQLDFEKPSLEAVYGADLPQSERLRAIHEIQAYPWRFIAQEGDGLRVESAHPRC